MEMNIRNSQMHHAFHIFNISTWILSSLLIVCPPHLRSSSSAFSSKRTPGMPKCPSNHWTIQHHWPSRKLTKHSQSRNSWGSLIRVRRLGKLSRTYTSVICTSKRNREWRTWKMTHETNTLKCTNMYTHIMYKGVWTKCVNLIRSADAKYFDANPQTHYAQGASRLWWSASSTHGHQGDKLLWRYQLRLPGVFWVFDCLKCGPPLWNTHLGEGWSSLWTILNNEFKYEFKIFFSIHWIVNRIRAKDEARQRIRSPHPSASAPDETFYLSSHELYMKWKVYLMNGYEWFIP